MSSFIYYRKRLLSKFDINESQSKIIANQLKSSMNSNFSAFPLTQINSSRPLKLSVSKSTASVGKGYLNSSKVESSLNDTTYNLLKESTNQLKESTNQLKKKDLIHISVLDDSSKYYNFDQYNMKDEQKSSLLYRQNNLSLPAITNYQKTFGIDHSGIMIKSNKQGEQQEDTCRSNQSSIFNLEKINSIKSGTSCLNKLIGIQNLSKENINQTDDREEERIKSILLDGETSYLNLQKKNEKKENIPNNLQQSNNNNNKLQALNIRNKVNKIDLSSYLEKLSKYNQILERDSQVVTSFISRMEEHTQKEEAQSSKRIIKSKTPKDTEKKMIRVKLAMDEEETEKLRRLISSLKVIVKFVEDMHQSDHNQSKHIRQFKKLLVNKKSLEEIFLNEQKDDFTEKFSVEELEKKFVVNEICINKTKNFIPKEKYDFSLLEDVEKFSKRIETHKLKMKLSQIDRIQEGIIQEQSIVLSKAKEMELQNKVQGSFQAYECVKSLSSESPAMMKNSTLAVDIYSFIKSDQKIKQLLKEENVQCYDKVAQTVNALHKNYLVQRKNIFYFK